MRASYLALKPLFTLGTALPQLGKVGLVRGSWARKQGPWGVFLSIPIAPSVLSVPPMSVCSGVPHVLTSMKVLDKL